MKGADHMKIGLAQMDIRFGDPESNYAQAEKWFQQAESEQCDILVFPELWTTGYDLKRIEGIADENSEKTIVFLSRLAKQYRINVIGGSVANKTDSGIDNRLIVIDSKGNFVKGYSKLHLFKLMDEHHYLLPGKEDGLFTLSGEQMAGLICYDIRFPEWVRKHVLSGAKILFVSAEWPEQRIDHWKVLLRARAIENQCYVAACNRVGSDPDNTFGGSSLIIDPWGEILAEGSLQEELVTAAVNLDTVDEVRKQIPIFDDRLPDFYR
ncbi:carbon-nitrogen family hydrolase [Rossellomorea marisflavi]|uniref:carbon-nitrogen family hydrolase n=3 Tax=Rossellomorea marisflavi TaxID=189381 RepID=UPI00345AA6C0